MRLVWFWTLSLSLLNLTFLVDIFCSLIDMKVYPFVNAIFVVTSECIWLLLLEASRDFFIIIWKNFSEQEENLEKL